MLAEERKKELHEQSQFGLAFSEVRRHQALSIKQAKLDVYQSKREEVKKVKEDLLQSRLRKQKDMASEEQAKKVRKDSIRAQLKASSQSYQEYLASKQNQLKNDYAERIEKEKALTYMLEQEAQHYEKLEA